MTPQRRIHSLLLSLCCHALQHLHVLFLEGDHLEILLDPAQIDGFGKDDTASVDLVGDENRCRRDLVLFCNGCDFGVLEEGRV